MFIYKLPHIIKRIFPNLIWEISPSVHENKYIYFTFDDGPTPEITNFVLEQLNKFKSKATFFCIGKNIQQNEDLIKLIISNGHAVGNHTMNHFNAWRVNKYRFIENVDLCNLELLKHTSNIAGFRPPYGRFSRYFDHFKQLQPTYMWSILTGDYRKSDKSIEILKECLPLLKPGAIIVFHDSNKAYHNLKIILPVFLEYCHNQNLILSTLPND